MSTGKANQRFDSRLEIEFYWGASVVTSIFQRKLISFEYHFLWHFISISWHSFGRTCFPECQLVQFRSCLTSVSSLSRNRIPAMICLNMFSYRRYFGITTYANTFNVSDHRFEFSILYRLRIICPILIEDTPGGLYWIFFMPTPLEKENFCVI